MADTSTAFLSALMGSGGGNAVSDLLGLEKTIAANSLWRQAAAPVLGAKFDTSTWSPMESLGVSAGQAFLGGLLNAMGVRDEASQMESIAKVLPQLYKDPLSVEKPEGVDSEAFAQLKLSSLKDNISRNQKLSEKLAEDLWGIKAAGLKKQSETVGELSGRKKFYGEGVEDPESPVTKTADQLRKELLGMKEISEFGDIKNRFNVLLKAEKDPSTVADLDFVYGVAKILDPSSVVRESEGQMVISSNSIPAATLGYLNKALSGGTALDRPKLLDLAQRHYDVRTGEIGSILDRYSDIATKRGADPSSVLPFTKESLKIARTPVSSNLESGDELQGQLKLILDKVRNKAVLTPEDEAVLSRARGLFKAPTRGGVPLG